MTIFVSPSWTIFPLAAAFLGAAFTLRVFCNVVHFRLVPCQHPNGKKNQSGSRPQRLEESGQWQSRVRDSGGNGDASGVPCGRCEAQLAQKQRQATLHKHRAGRESRPASLEHMVIVLGSGGHTGEMIKLIQGIKSDRLRKLVYVVANTDKESQQVIERRIKNMSNAEFRYIPRCREVGGSFILAAVSVLRVGLMLLPSYLRDPPDLILTNGPGTALPVAMAGLIAESILGRRIRLFYVESFCRVKTLSMTGKILYALADRFFVYWPHLADLHPRATSLRRHPKCELALRHSPPGGSHLSASPSPAIEPE